MQEYRRTYCIFVDGGKPRLYIYDDEGLLYRCTIVDEPVPHTEAIVYPRWTWDQILSGWFFD